MSTDPYTLAARNAAIEAIGELLDSQSTISDLVESANLVDEDQPDAEWDAAAVLLESALTAIRDQLREQWELTPTA